MTPPADTPLRAVRGKGAAPCLLRTLAHGAD